MVYPGGRRPDTVGADAPPAFLVCANDDEYAREKVTLELFRKFLAAHLPAKRIGRPADLAAAVLYLLGNSYVTGTVLDVDGGALLV